MTAIVNTKSNLTRKSPKGIWLLPKEVAELCRYVFRTPKAEKAITFYSEHEGYYPCFEGLLEKLSVQYGQTVCYITSSPGDAVLSRAEPRLRTFYLNRLLPFFMVYVNCRVFVMTVPELNRSYLRRSINPVRYVYVFHALVSTHMMYPFGAFDHYDCILCTGSHHREELRRHEEMNGLKPKKLVDAGYGRLELVYQAYKQYLLRGPSPQNKKTVLVAPSWGAENVIESCGERLVELLLKEGYRVIVRPHPETMKRSPRVLASMVSRFGKDDSFTLETSVATHNSLLQADVMICDCSGVALEYAFGTERPVLFLDVPLKIRNPRYETLGIEPLELSLRREIGVVVPLGELESVPQAILGLLADSEEHRARIVKLREQIVYSFGHSSDIGARCIMDLAMQTDQEC